MTVNATSSPGPSTSRVSLAAAGFFVTSFVMSANGNVLPQIFFQRFYPTNKVLLLAACLFAGTCAALVGVFASRKVISARRAGSVVFVMLAAEASLFLVGDAVSYIALNAVAQFGANYFTNAIDHAAVARAGSKRQLHDAVSTMARLFGVLVAPAFFTRLYERTSIVFAALAIAFLIACSALISTTSLPVLPVNNTQPEGSALPASQKLGELGSADRFFLGHAVGVYVALYLFAANLMYFLRDLLHLDDAQRHGGTAIFVVFLCAVLANGFASSFRRTKGPRSWALAVPVPVLTSSALVIAYGGALSLFTIATICILVGSTYGVFLAEVRDHASRGAREQNKTELLTIFNNLSNLSSLIAFGIMVTLAMALRSSPTGTSFYVLALIGGLPIATLPLLFAFARAKKKELLRHE